MEELTSMYKIKMYHATKFWGDVEVADRQLLEEWKTEAERACTTYLEICKIREDWREVEEFPWMPSLAGKIGWMYAHLEEWQDRTVGDGIDALEQKAKRLLLFIGQRKAYIKSMIETLNIYEEE